MIYKCTTQEELDRAVKERTQYDEVWIIGSAQVTAYGSSQVTACDSSQVRACGSSQVTACGSSQVRACDSSQVTACDSSQVTAYGSSQVRASKFVAVTKHGDSVRVIGGVQIEIPKIKTVEDWCEFYGVQIIDGVVTLYKAVTSDFKSGYRFDYTPGTTPVAPDWDGGKRECGGGLHFCPLPVYAIPFMSDFKKFVACPVRVSDLAVVNHPNYPTKIKGRGCCAPVWEVDIDGKKILSA